MYPVSSPLNGTRSVLSSEAEGLLEESAVLELRDASEKENAMKKSLWNFKV